jgi:hypothetical protein
MHGAAHLKPLGNEVHGSYYTGGKRVKPHNPDEVGPVKDHFSEGRQQENLRQPAKQDAFSEDDAPPVSFEDEIEDQGLYKSRKAQYASQALSANLTAHAINFLSGETAPQGAATHKRLGMTHQVLQTSEPSLDDLLTLMKAK